MQIQDDPVEQWSSKYPDVFEGLGAFEEECHLTLKENAKPIAHPPRKVPVATKEILKEELDRLTKQKSKSPHHGYPAL